MGLHYSASQDREWSCFESLIYMPINPNHDSGMRIVCAELEPKVIDSSTHAACADIVEDSERVTSTYLWTT